MQNIRTLVAILTVTLMIGLFSYWLGRQHAASPETMKATPDIHSSHSAMTVDEPIDNRISKLQRQVSNLRKLLNAQSECTGSQTDSSTDKYPTQDSLADTNESQPIAFEDIPLEEDTEQDTEKFGEFGIDVYESRFQNEGVDPLWSGDQEALLLQGFTSNEDFTGLDLDMQGCKTSYCKVVVDSGPNTNWLQFIGAVDETDFGDVFPIMLTNPNNNNELTIYFRKTPPGAMEKAEPSEHWGKPLKK